MESEKLIAAMRRCEAPRGHRCSSCPLLGEFGIAPQCRHKTILASASALERLTADNAAKDAEIARLREENHQAVVDRMYGREREHE